MLKVVGQLFRVYETPEELASLEADKQAQKAWKDWMESRDLRHAGKKMYFILNANRVLLDKYDGHVPEDRNALLELPGVGRHVSSVTLAWVHNAPEFGVDVHVRRIMERWGFISKEEPEQMIEAKVKEIIQRDKVGRFSRAFVDHGQSTCGYTPNCTACHLRHSCPSANKVLDW
jgi:endonuclease-3